MPEIFPNQKIVARSLKSVWHPCTQMKHHERLPLVPIARGEGAWLIDFEGRRYLDAVSSWWVNLFGHANPRINAALKNQLDQLEHVMLAGFTHEPAVQLSERLAKLTGLGHAFYGSDGASAVEIALKMSFHYWRNAGKSGKKKFVSLEGSYHGETIGALAVTDVAIFRDAYGPLLNHNLCVAFPIADNVEPASTDITAAISPASRSTASDSLENMLAAHHHEIAAFIIEPLVQGAAGMRMYHPDYLQRARALCNQYQVHLIADEIMTGFGRTGSMFAYEQAGVQPDFVCLSKGLTGGYLPLSCVLTTDPVYDAFYHDDVTRGFLHSHSYTGNALACRAALATLDIFESDHVIEKNRLRSAQFFAHTAAIRQHPSVENFRHLGMIWAFEINVTKSSTPTFARDFFAASMQRGVLLRPIGNTVYFMPPYIIEEDEFIWLVKQTVAVIDEMRMR